MQELSGMLVVVSDAKECLIASAETEPGATITTNRNLVYITRQFVWMEIFAQRLYAHIGSEFATGMTPEDRHMLENFAKG
jgi:Cd2+/Zn2+-exporting ATPase